MYLDTAEFNFNRFASSSLGLFEVEGRLRSHEFHAGRYWDQITLALYRESWTEFQKSGSVLAVTAPHASVLRQLVESDRPVSRDDFISILTTGLGLKDLPAPTADLRVDLGLDSLNVYELYCLLQDAAGFDVPVALIEELLTVDDLYATFSTYRNWGDA